MKLHKIIVHELKKESGNFKTELITSDSALKVEKESLELTETLLKSYQDDKILYAEFDYSPGHYFPERFVKYQKTDRSEKEFINFSIDTIGNLETIINSRILAKGGYMIFAEYTNVGNNFIAIFLIRDTDGKILKRTKNSFSIQNIEYLDTSNLAMACRINENKLNDTETNYISFTRVKQANVSDYFTQWISTLNLESSTDYTNELYRIINQLETPLNQETNTKYTIDELRNMIYDYANSRPQNIINLHSLGEHIYNDKDIVVTFINNNNLSVDTEFRIDKKALRKFVKLNINRDGINLKFSRGDIGTKIKVSKEDSNVVIIDSASFAQALKTEIDNGNS